MDNKQINQITMKSLIPIPTFWDFSDKLDIAKIFLKIDLCNGYHQIRIRRRDEWRTTFKLNEGLYEWFVMPFGFSNMPSTFMHLISHVFFPVNLLWCILMISWFILLMWGHEHLRMVIKVLRKYKLYINLKKCIFLQSNA